MPGLSSHTNQYHTTLGSPVKNMVTKCYVIVEMLLFLFIAQELGDLTMITLPDPGLWAKSGKNIGCYLTVAK